MVSDDDNGMQFSNMCNQELNFQDGEYEVCMQDMIFSVGAWDNVRPGGNTILVTSVDPQQPDRTLYIPTGRYTSSQTLFSAINNRFQTMYNHGNYLAFDTKPAKPAVPVRYWRTASAGGYEIKACTVPLIGDYTTPAEPAEPEYVVLRNLAVIQTNYYKTGAWHAVEDLRLTFCNELALLLGIVPRIAAPTVAIKAGWQIETSKIDVHRNNLPMMWVFADFVGKTMFGTAMLPLLRLVPIQVESGNLEHSMFSLQYYLPVQHNRIQQFAITIREHWNDSHPIKIIGSVIIVLHFRVRE
jgi:hypothetical protein